jgi:signal transduction histidine kinase/DNA-binding NarL/FixJ family response regulator
MYLTGTQMHLVTLIFVCIEIVIFFYLLIYRIARPDDKTTYLNIILICLLIIYNVTGGLLPDKQLPGSYFLQMIIAYGTGFITPCYFPYYVYKAFDLVKMKFQAYVGVYLFLVAPYFVFVFLFAVTNDLDKAKDLLIIPVLYALWVIISLVRALRFKYQNNFSTRDSREEIVILLLSLTPWVCLPIIDFFNLGQAVEALITNGGFLLLLALNLKRHITEIRAERDRLIFSEKRLLNYNTNLQNEVDKRTKELEQIIEQRTNTFVNLAHDTKTPLTLIKNYLEEHINKTGTSEELEVVKNNLDQLMKDMVNLFDLEKFKKGFSIYNHQLVCNFTELLQGSATLFKLLIESKNLKLTIDIEDNIHVKADPLSIRRIINNLLENAIKFTPDGGSIKLVLKTNQDKIIFQVADTGSGISPDMHQKVFKAYHQISNKKFSSQGMGLGLVIVKKVVKDLQGKISIDSNPLVRPGTVFTVTLNKYALMPKDIVAHIKPENVQVKLMELKNKEIALNPAKKTILILEDQSAMANYLARKLQEHYNIYTAFNGNEALKKLKEMVVLPDLFISDVMMDKMDGFSFLRIISRNSNYSHIPLIFLSAKASLNDKISGLKLGAIDYIEKPFSLAELLQRVETVLLNSEKQKKNALDSVLKNLQLKTPVDDEKLSQHHQQNYNLYQLTPRERDIADLLCKGHKNKTIAEMLSISERTVATHIQNLYEKVDTSSKIEFCNKMEQ